MKNLLLLGFFFLSMSIFAQQTPQNILNDFFSTYQKDPGKAVIEMYKTNVWTERIIDDINNVASKVNSFSMDVMGQYNGYELITTKKFSDSFVLYSYLVKYDRQPIRYIFKFYKPKDKWVLYAFKIDDSFDEEIEEAAKLYYLDLNK